MARLALLSLALTLLAACSTAKSLERVRHAPHTEGLSFRVASSAATVTHELPGVLETLGYRDIDVEPLHQGAQVLAARPSSWQSWGHGLRVLVEPLSLRSAGASMLRVVFARRILQNVSEDLDAARDRLVRALRTHFGAP